LKGGDESYQSGGHGGSGGPGIVEKSTHVFLLLHRWHMRLMIFLIQEDQEALVLEDMEDQVNNFKHYSYTVLGLITFVILAVANRGV